MAPGSASVQIPPPRPFTLRRGLFYVVFALFFALSYWAGAAVEFSLPRLIEGGPHMQDFLSRMWPPDQSILGKVWTETMLTIQLAWVATVISAVISLPIGFIAATNVFDSKPLRSITVFILNAIRAVRGESFSG